jgi:hypothetical protein
VEIRVGELGQKEIGVFLSCEHHYIAEFSALRYGPNGHHGWVAWHVNLISSQNFPHSAMGRMATIVGLHGM